MYKPLSVDYNNSIRKKQTNNNGDNQMAVPQTIKFKLRVHFMRMESWDHKPSYIDTIFESFEEMMQAYYKETHRRALKDRATGGEYQQILTEHGKAVITDEDRRLSHKDAIDGTWFEMNPRKHARQLDAKLYAK